VRIQRLGGLVRRLPATTAVFLVAAATIIGLPPFGGFPSEGLTLETLMQGFRVPVLAAEVSLALAGALLALTAAVAGIAFVKAAFVTFLGVPRGPRPAIRAQSRRRRGGCSSFPSSIPASTTAASTSGTTPPRDASDPAATRRRPRSRRSWSRTVSSGSTAATGAATWPAS